MTEQIVDDSQRSVTKPGGFDRAWREITHAANLLYAQDKFGAAARLYSDAYHEARMLFAEAWSGMDSLAPHAPPMMVISASNAARNDLKQGKSQLAADQLISALNIFNQALSSPRAAPALKRACALHLPRLVTLAVSFEIDAEHDRLLVAADTAKSTVLNFLQTTAH